MYGREKTIEVYRSGGLSGAYRFIQANVNGTQFYPHSPRELSYEAVFKFNRSVTDDIKMSYPGHAVEERTQTVTASGTMTYQANGPMFLPPSSGSEYVVGDYTKVRIIMDITFTWRGNLDGYRWQAYSSSVGSIEVAEPLKLFSDFNRRVLIDKTYDRFTGEFTDNGSFDWSGKYIRGLPYDLSTHDELYNEIEKPIYSDDTLLCAYGTKSIVLAPKTGVLCKVYSSSDFQDVVEYRRIPVITPVFSEDSWIFSDHRPHGPRGVPLSRSILVTAQASDLFSCNYTQYGQLKETLGNG